ncbi:MAG: diacylglycerol kinase family lipid kinase [Anaerolineae bacterium]|nr:diacylglycerol kinase family lipid kinase [Anaerolineae bacterium]
MKGLVIYNPTAGPWDVKRELQQVRQELAQCGWSLDIELSGCVKDVSRLARQAASAQLDAVWAAGGDGTVREVVNGLVGTETAMGVLPVGSRNVWARQLNLPVFSLAHPFHLREAAVSQARGVVRPVDVGQVGSQYFLLWAGIGFDAYVTKEMEPRHRLTKRLGTLPYIVASLMLARDFSGVRVRMILDGRIVRGRVVLAVVSNTQMYAAFQMADHARLDDGLLDLFIFKGTGFSYILRHAIKVFSGRHLQDPKVVHRQVRQVAVWAEQPMDVQADGDPAGTTPISLRVVPRALRILVPPQSPNHLFSSEVR